MRSTIRRILFSYSPCTAGYQPSQVLMPVNTFSSSRKVCSQPLVGGTRIFLGGGEVVP